LVLLPWFLMYGISSVMFSHGSVFGQLYRDGVPNWTTRLERPYSPAIPEDADDRQLGARILEDLGLEGAFGTYRPNMRQFNVYLFDFWSATRISYFLEEGRLLAEDKRFRWDHFLTGLHARGGFRQDSVLHDAWAVIVDIVQLAMLLWVASGIYMWWLLERTRRWGILALGGGLVSFAIFILML